MEQIVLTYGLPKETVTAIMMLYKNTKVKVCSAGWRRRLLWHCLCCAARGHINPIPVYYLPRLCAFNERKWLYFGKGKKHTIPCTNDFTDYADDIALLTNTPTQAKSLLHCLERVAGSIGLHVNADKTEYMYFNQKGNISTLNCRSLKLVDKFTYFRSSIPSTENDINTRLARELRAINWLLVIWNSELSDKIKQFFQAAVVSILLYGCTTWMLTKCMEKKQDSNCTRMLQAILNKSWK